MHKVYIDQVRPGLVLGKTIYNDRGNILLARGVALTPRYIDALRAQGLYAAYVLDSFADDLEPPDLLSDRVRTAKGPNTTRCRNRRGGRRLLRPRLRPTAHTGRRWDPPSILTTLHEIAGSHLNREIVSRFLSILPAYPIGTEVVVISSKLRGYRGVVSELNPRDIHRPRVRIILDPAGQAIAPMEVNTSEERDVELAMPSYADFVS